MRSHPRFRPHHLLLPALLAAALALPVRAQPAPAAPAWPPAAADKREQLMPLDVSINTVKVGSWTLLEKEGVLYAPEDALVEWRLQLNPKAQPIEFRGKKWYSLGELPGFHARIKYADQSVELVFSPSAFVQTAVSDEPVKRPPLSPVEPALFLNLDTNLTVTHPQGTQTSEDLGFLSEVGYATRWGVLTSSFVGHNMAGLVPETGRTVKRLETALSRDFPEQNLTLRLGDGTTRSGMWGRAVYFGGIQVSRNFGLTPGFITQPIPVITGTSSAPSTVELYVNDALRQTSQVPTGPFVVQNFPTLSGSGEATVVVRDVLGRETIITQPFFENAQLLAPGLSDWSVESGAVRVDLGNESAHYGEGFASGTYRYGLTSTATGETRLEASRRMRNAGVGLTQALFSEVLGQVALAASDGNSQRGGLWLVGLSHDSLRHGFTFRMQGATPGFNQLGLDPLSARMKHEDSISYTYSSEHFGSFGAAFARVADYGSAPLKTASLSYANRIGARSSLTVTATRVMGAVTSNAVAATLTVPLDNHITNSGNVGVHGGKVDAYATVDQGLPGETGLAWRVLGGARNSEPFSEAGVRLATEKAMMSADVSASRLQQALQLDAQTGFVLVDGRGYQTPWVQDSFALVQVPGYANVGVGFHGRTLVHTDADGYALVPRLMPYETNSISLNANDLPISAELDTIEMQAVPAARSAVKLVFPVRSGRGALLTILLDDGEPAPAGAEVTLAGDKESFFVARRGESFVTGLQDHNTARLTWNGSSCTFAVDLPAGNKDDIARVGPLACHGVKR